MKITKRQLRRIIKEERSRLLNEQIPPDDPYASVGGPDPSPKGRSNDVMSQLHTAIDALIGALGNEEAHQELLGIVEDWDMETHVTETRGTSSKDMPSAWQQILGTCLKGKK